MDTKKYLFIGGLHRSGTSILYKTLASSRKISKHVKTGVAKDEGQHIQSVYPSVRKVGKPGNFCLLKSYHYTEKSPFVTIKNRKKILQEWSRYWDYSKPILMEKSPPNLIHTRFLQALIPNSYFIIIMRNPIVVAEATSKWNHQKLEKHIRNWVVGYDTLYNDIKHLKNVLIIKYENLCENPAKIMKQVEKLLGESLDIDPKMLDKLVNCNGKYLDIYKKGQKKVNPKIIKKYGAKILQKYHYGMKF